MSRKIPCPPLPGDGKGNGLPPPHPCVFSLPEFPVDASMRIMPGDYLPILIQIIIALGFAVGALLFSVLIGRVGKKNTVKNTAYECGMIAADNVQPRFSVKFYLVAMLFILFDIEVVFMYPWAVVYRDFLAEHETGGISILFSMLSFVGIILAGYIYAIKKGALEWKN